MLCIYREIDEYASVDRGASRMHASRAGGSDADMAVIGDVPEQAYGRRSKRAAGVEPFVLQAHARIVAEVAAPKRQYGFAIAVDIAAVDPVGRGRGGVSQCGVSSSYLADQDRRAVRYGWYALLRYPVLPPRPGRRISYRASSVAATSWLSAHRARSMDR